MSARVLSYTRLTAVLLGAVATALLALGTLTLLHKSTVVEARLSARDFEFTVASQDPLRAGMELLSAELRVSELSVTGASDVHLFDAGGKTIRTGLDPLTTGPLAFTSPTRFEVSLAVPKSTRVTLTAISPERFTLLVDTPANAEDGWICQVGSVENLILRSGTSQELPEQLTGGPQVREMTLAGNPPVRLRGQRAGSWEFTLERPLGGPGVAHVIALDTGETLATIELPTAPAESGTALVTGNKMVLLSATHFQPTPILQEQLLLHSPRFLRTEGTVVRSFVSGGTIRFPSGERGDVDIPGGSILVTDETTIFSLHALTSDRGGFEVLLSGRPGSIRMGPNVHLTDQLAPNYLIWLFTHKTVILVFTAVVWLVAATVAGLKLFGWVKGKD